jgi:hypothetical protein
VIRLVVVSLICVVAGISLPHTSLAQALFDPNSVKYEASNLFPIVSETDLLGAPDSALPIEAVKKIDDRCRTKIPTKFTPMMLDNYCTCSTAATQGTMTIKDIEDLQKETNRVAGNKIFEKYVTNVMKPCTESIIQETEYLLCITAQNNDWRIRLPIPYCKCVSYGVQKHFETFGLEDMMVAWASAKRYGYETPIDTLWDSENLINTRSVKQKECVGQFMDPNFFR